MITMFAGNTKHTLDSKNRISIPAKFRRWVTENEECTFVVTVGVDPCIVAWPYTEWETQAQKLLGSFSEYNPEQNAFIRRYASNAEYVKCDKNGRILLPQNLIDYAKIISEAQVVGMLNRFELWEPGLLNAYRPEMANSTMMPLAEIAAQIK